MSTIFLLQEQNRLLEMAERAYDSEDLLQRPPADHSNILVGDQFHGAEPKRWLLVGREARVPCEENGSRRGPLDHLFVDQDGIPTLVEVKRSSDTRIRREVVAQLDYAANAMAYWQAREVRSRFEANCEPGVTANQRLSEFLRSNSEIGADDIADRFWRTVDTNLRAGNIRMVLLAKSYRPNSAES